jgi:hypothetical protein
MDESVRSAKRNEVTIGIRNASGGFRIARMPI